LCSVPQAAITSSPVCGGARPASLKRSAPGRNCRTARAGPPAAMHEVEPVGVEIARRRHAWEAPDEMAIEGHGLSSHGPRRLPRWEVVSTSSSHRGEAVRPAAALSATLPTLDERRSPSGTFRPDLNERDGTEKTAESMPRERQLSTPSASKAVIPLTAKTSLNPPRPNLTDGVEA
jgi:hypothetical protein